MRKDQAVAAQMPIPSGVVGHDPNYRSVNQYDPVLANKLLDYFGYKKGAGRLSDAARRQAAGDPAGDRNRGASIASSTSCGRSRWTRSASGWSPQSRKFADNAARRPRRASCMMWGQRGSPTIPTATTSCSSSTARTPAQSNNGCYESKAFDELYEQVAHAAARFARAQPPVPRHDAADGSRRRVEPAVSRDAQRADPPVGPGLQEASDPAGRMCLHGPRRRAAADASVRRIVRVQSRHAARAARSRCARRVCRRAGPRPMPPT